MSFPRYSAYKDSGVEWLGEVPEHWDAMAIKHIVATPITDGPHETPLFLDEGVPFVSAEAVSSGKIDFAKIRGFISKEEHERYSLKYKPQRNDIYMIKSGATTGITAIVETDIEFNIWSPLAVIRCSSKSLARFVLQFMRSQNFQEAVTLNWSFGTQQNIGMGVIGNLFVTVPPIQEQTTIAAFLDCETAKIDNLINEQKKLIELLKEKRQAVISTAVTKGLNPHAPMKESGVEWLGKVPDGWEVKPIKKLGNIVSGYAFPSSDFVKEGEIRVLKISNIQTGYLDWSDESYLPKSSYIDNFSVKNGDIIFALTRPIISTGIKAAVATIGEGEIVLLNQRNALFRPFPIAERKFLYYILFDCNFKAAFENCIDSTGQQPNISPIDIGNIFVAVPPINEQTTIVAFLDQETAKIDNLIQQAQKATTLLQERRTALISAAVTGKIDVRGFATNMSEVA